MPCLFAHHYLGHAWLSTRCPAQASLKSSRRCYHPGSVVTTRLTIMLPADETCYQMHVRCSLQPGFAGAVFADQARPGIWRRISQTIDNGHPPVITGAWWFFLSSTSSGAIVIPERTTPCPACLSKCFPVWPASLVNAVTAINFLSSIATACTQGLVDLPLITSERSRLVRTQFS